MKTPKDKPPLDEVQKAVQYTVQVTWKENEAHYRKIYPSLFKSTPMITKQEYLAALDIVFAYNQQSGNDTKMTNNDPLYFPKIGDIVVFSKLGESTTHLTVGKPYLIIDTRKDWRGRPVLRLIGDNKKKKAGAVYASCEFKVIPNKSIEAQLNSEGSDPSALPEQ